MTLRRYLPPNLERVAAGMPADVRSPQRRKYVSILQTPQTPEPSAIVEYNSQEEEEEAASFSSLSVPLPALLEGSSSVVEEGCDNVRRALHNLASSTGESQVTDLSLADSVEAWNMTNVHDPTTRLVQYQTSDRESALPRFHGKPIRGQPLDMTTDHHQGGEFSSGSQSDFAGVRTFYATFAEGYGHHGKQLLEDSHLCPIQLPFRQSCENHSYVFFQLSQCSVPDLN